MILICISWKGDDVEHRFISLSAIRISFLEKFLFKYFALFEIGLLALSLSLRVLYAFWMQVPYHINDSQIFSPIVWVVKECAP